MLNIKATAELVGVTAPRIKQILKENDHLDIVRLHKNNNMAAVPPQTVTELLSLRGMSYTKKRVAIKSQKGGIGGTSLTLLTALRLAELGAKILVIDLDSEANSTSFLMQEELDLNSANTLLEVVKNNLSLKECVVNSRFANVKLIPAKGMLRRVDKLVADKNPKTLIDKMLSEVDADFDVIYLDLPPTYSRLTESAYLACDLIILPFDQSSFSIEGAILTNEDLQASMVEYEVNKKIEIKVLMNKYSSNTNAGKEAFSYVANHLSDKLLPFHIKNSTDIVTAINAGKSLFEIKSGAEIKANIDELANYISPLLQTTQTRH